MADGEPIYFTSGSQFRAWLEKHHYRASEVLVGFHKVGTGKPSMTWSESVDEALCFGWIDGVRRTVDAGRWCIRFTPRKPSSKWSAVNVKKVQALIDAGRMRPEGLAAFARRADQGAGYSYEEITSTPFDHATEQQFKANTQAWGFFEAQPPGYRRTATHWVMSAKRAETRAKRLATLIDDSANGRRLGMLSRPNR